MPRRTPLAVALMALMALLCLPAIASGIPIHKHVTVHRVLHQRPGAPPIIDLATVVRVVNLAPRDSDQDGLADTKDPCPHTAYSDGGCPPPPAPPAPTTTYVSSSAPVTSSSYGGDYSSVPGVPASFAACVALRESSNGAGSSNIYGIIPASGSNAGSGTLAEQQAAFSQLYAQYGTAPWAPYDGC